MKKTLRFIFITLILLCVAVFGTMFLLHGKNIAVLNPKGLIASKEKGLIITVCLLISIVVVPLFFLTIFTAYKYREGNDGANYSPEWDSDPLLEIIWWAIPAAIILVLSLIVWHTSSTLNYYKPIKSKVPPITIQVISLDWKWLFIYPKEKVASVNFIEIPQNTPIDFELTSDTVMNAFWIPNLAGQIMTMPGMETKIHILAYNKGTYYGVSSNISGSGFAGMRFAVQVSSLKNFNKWIESANRSSNILTMTSYKKLAKPSSYNHKKIYSLKDTGLFNAIVENYMVPVFGGPIMLTDSKG